MKVLHIIHWFNRGGIENWLLSLLRELYGSSLNNVLEMNVLCKGLTTGEMSADVARLGVKIHHLPQGKVGYFRTEYKDQFVRLLRNEKYDAVHSHLGDMSGVYLEAAAVAGVTHRYVSYHSIKHQLARTSLPMLSYVPGLDSVFSMFQNFQRKRVSAAATKIIGCSQSVLDAHFPAWRNDFKYAVLSPAINVDKFAMAPKVALPSVKKVQPFKIINVGSVDYSKNQKVIPLVAKELKLRNIPCVFYVVGQGNKLGELHREILRAGVADSVVLLGRRQDVPGLLADADIAFHPSIVEGFPVSVLEYQAAGLPVCGSNIGPMLEACAPNNHDLLARPNDIGQYVSNITQLFEDVAAYKVYAANAFNWAKEFSIKENLKALYSLYIS